VPKPRGRNAQQVTGRERLTARARVGRLRGDASRKGEPRPGTVRVVSYTPRSGPAAESEREVRTGEVSEGNSSQL
jgi:hypothetical protein